VTCLEHQHVVARAQRVRQRGFPCARPGRRLDHDRLLRLEDPHDAFDDLQTQRAEFRAAVVDMVG
jgi:hypothetical protein